MKLSLQFQPAVISSGLVILCLKKISIPDFREFKIFLYPLRANISKIGSRFLMRISS